MTHEAKAATGCDSCYGLDCVYLHLAEHHCLFIMAGVLICDLAGVGVLWSYLSFY